MNNFTFRNKAELNTTEIDIFGDIGEGWFEDGVTFENVKAQLSEIKTSKIKLNVSSLGGDVNDALVIYNLLKTHPAEVTANIMGFTASSGTIIAMGSDNVEMDENAMFLVHNAWTGVMGNQHELREVADNLEQIDNKLISIYKEKTSNRKSSISKLMKEERWLDAEEAKELGFVDSIYKPMKAAASLNRDIEIINKSKDLPKIENKMATLKEEFHAFKNEIMADIKAVFKSENKEITAEELQNKVDSIINAKTEGYENKITELETEVANKVAEVEASKTELNSKKVELEGIQNKVTEIETKLTQFEANIVKTDSEKDPNPNGNESKRSEGENILSNILNSATAIDKLNAGL